MNDTTYKSLFILSFACNIVLLALLFKPLPKEEQELLDYMRDTRSSQTTLLDERVRDDIKHKANIIVREISEDWEFDKIISYFTVEDADNLQGDTLKKITNMWSRLGRFKEQNRAGKIKVVPGQKGHMIYAGMYTFEFGEAFVRLTLWQKDSVWYLKNINIRSDAFLD